MTTVAPASADWPDRIELGQARSWLRAEAQRSGAVCPCCAQRAQVYRRAITSSMARDLVAIARQFAVDEPFHLPTVLGYGGDAAKLAYWELIAEDPRPRDDGGRPGWWTLTVLGDRFARGHVSLPRHAHVYDGRLLGLSGPPVSIVQALGKRFNLTRLLAGEQ